MVPAREPIQLRYNKTIGRLLVRSRFIRSKQTKAGVGSRHGANLWHDGFLSTGDASRPRFMARRTADTDSVHYGYHHE